MEAESLVDDDEYEDVDDDEYEDGQMDLSAKTCLQIPLQIATCAGSSGGAQPLSGPYRVPAYSPEPRQRRGRGGVKGFEIAQKVIQDGKITVEFDEAGGIWKALGKYGAWFESAVGIHTRNICEPFHDAWKDVSDVDKRTIQDRMLVFFYGRQQSATRTGKVHCTATTNATVEKVSRLI